MAPHVEEPQHDCPGIDGVATPVGGGQLPRGHGLGLGLAGGALPPPALGGSKRGRTRSGNDLTRLGSTSAAASSALSDPLVPPASGAPPPGEPMARYFGRVKGAALGLGGVGFGVVTQEPSAGGFVPAADGLYIHKRPIRGLGSGNPLAVGGSIFYHTLVYLKTGGKVNLLSLPLPLPRLLLSVPCPSVTE